MTDTSNSKDLLLLTIERLGYEVSHIHQDLIFVSKNQFILKRGDVPDMIDLYFNERLAPERAEELMASIESAGLENNLIISYKGAYTITDNNDETLSVEFFDLADDA